MIARGVFAAAVLCAAATSPHAQTPDAQARLSPGAIVLLANSTEPAATETLRRALSDPDPDVRRAAARVTAVAHQEVFGTLRHALATEQDAGVVAELVKDIMAVGGAQAEATVERYAKRPDAVAEIAEWFARMDAAQFSARLARWAAVPHAQAALATIVPLAILTHPASRDAILQAWQPIATPAQYRSAATGAPSNDARSIMQTPSGLAAHLVGDTFAAAACPARDVFTVAGVTFGPDGRPRAIEVPKELTDECRSAVTALARISTADQGDPALLPHQIVVPMGADYRACTAQAYDGPVLYYEGSYEGIRTPRLRKEVKPEYSHEAMQQKLEAVVEFMGVVSSTGCVTSMRVVRSASILDIQGLKAILQWRFYPAQYGDRPIPFVVDIELTFTLKG